MPTSAPMYTDSGSEPASYHASPPPRELIDRVQHLEAEVAELRNTIARFADIVIGEVKDLRNSQGEAPALPPALSDSIPITAVASDAPAGQVGPSANAPPPRRPWLLTELLRDFSSMLRMYLDPRYRLRRSTQFLVPLIVVLFLGNQLFFTYLFAVPILSTILVKLIDVVLAILLYQVLSSELARYRQVLAQLAAWQNYRGRHTTVVVNSEPAMTQLETE